MKLSRFGLAVLTAATALLGAAGTAQAQAKKPNIVVIMSDDVDKWTRPPNPLVVNRYKRRDKSYGNKKAKHPDHLGR